MFLSVPIVTVIKIMIEDFIDEKEKKKREISVSQENTDIEKL